MKYKYYISKKCDVYSRDNNVLIVNNSTGLSLKVSKTCWTIVSENIEKGYDIVEIVDAMEDKSDKEYIGQLCDTLQTMGIIIDKLTYNSENQLTSVDIAITNRCNLSCKHCCTSAMSINESDKLSSQDLYEIADKVIYLRPSSIVISGGEPMVLTEFIDLIKYIKSKYDGSMVLMTNGTLINEKNVKVLVDTFDKINISLDGYNEESCSSIRGKGVFDKVIRNIQLLISYGYLPSDIITSMVITSSNENGINKFVELNKKMGTLHITRIFTPLGRGEKNADLLIPKNVKNISYSMEHFRNKKIRPRAGACSAGKRRIAIDYDGCIYPCMVLNDPKYSYGNMKDIVDLKDFIQNKKYLETKGFQNFSNIIPENNEKCSKCDVRAFCWYCLADCNKYMNCSKFDEICQVRKEELVYIWDMNN